MNRKEFIQSCGYACLGVGTLGLLLQSCASTKIHHASIEGDELIVPLSLFEINKGTKMSFKKYIVVQQAQLKYPIFIYRFSENNFKALLMRCTHQGAELSAFGDKLICAAHGSEFNNQGEVMNRPADKPLRSFPIQLKASQLHLSLKAI